MMTDEALKVALEIIRVAIHRLSYVGPVEILDQVFDDLFWEEQLRERLLS